MKAMAAPLATVSQLDRRQMAESGRGGSRLADYVQMVRRSDAPRVKAVAIKATISVPAITHCRNEPVEPNTGFGLAKWRGSRRWRIIALEHQEAR